MQAEGDFRNNVVFNGLLGGHADGVPLTRSLHPCSCGVVGEEVADIHSAIVAGNYVHLSALLQRNKFVVVFVVHAATGIHLALSLGGLDDDAMLIHHLAFGIEGLHRTSHASKRRTIHLAAILWLKRSLGGGFPVGGFRSRSQCVTERDSGLAHFLYRLHR